MTFENKFYAISTQEKNKQKYFVENSKLLESEWFNKYKEYQFT